MEPTNWKTLNHEGPSMPVLTSTSTTNDETMFQGALQLTNSKAVIRLNRIQTFLVSMYYERYHLKVDKTFQKNFWKSLKLPVSIHDSSVVVQFIKPRKLWSLVYTPSSDVRVNGHKVDGVCGHVDGPSIFCGRDSQHPKRGTCKWGVQNKDVTLNMSLSSVPAARQRGFVHFVELPHVQWIASWKDTITSERRYINLKRNDNINKFDDARHLKSKLSKLHKQLNISIQSANPKHQQLALAVYFIEHLCIRVGNEKDVEHEADTVGCCTLRAHTHVRIQKEDARIVCISFSGKDSVPFKRACTLPPMFFKVAKDMLQQKNVGDVFFNLVNPSTLNRYIQRVAPTCTAKSFRTMRASVTFERVLSATGDPVRANEDVAKLLNHRRMKNTKPNLETSRLNYIDPRIYHSFCKKTGQNPKPNWFTGNGGNADSFKF